MTRPRLSPVTWAVLDVYAGTLEGQSVSGLREHLNRTAPRGRMKGTAQITARGLGALDECGHLTSAGERAARAAVHRLNLGTAGGGHDSL